MILMHLIHKGHNGDITPKAQLPWCNMESVVLIKHPLALGNSDIIWQFVIPTNFNGKVGPARRSFKYCQRNSFILNLDIKLVVSNSF